MTQTENAQGNEQKGLIDIRYTTEQERFSRTVTTFVDADGEYWYSAREMSEILGFSGLKGVHKWLPTFQKGTTFIETAGGQQAILIVNESGLSRLILKSKTPEAQALINRVADVILPQIRKQGGYIRDWETFKKKALGLDNK